MIVNYTEKGWEVITQRAHGLLAAQVAMQWRKKDRPERWTETVLAIAEHDDASIELEADDLLTPQGGPVNFAMKLFEAGHCKRLQDFSLSKSRYIALLTSIHMVFLHHKEAKENQAAQNFIEGQLKLQDTWLKELHLTRAQVDHTYGLMEWCDAFSLLLCQHDIQPEHRVIEVSKGPDHAEYKLSQKENGCLTIKPWPFESKKFKLTLEYRLIGQLQFNSNDEFKSSFLEADVMEKEWQLEK
jgi:hypothetical protein